MSNPIDQNLLENKKERLHIQREVLHLMKASHIDWTKSATDAETKRIHEVMVELIKEMAAHCEHLLDTFQAQDNK